MRFTLDGSGLLKEDLLSFGLLFLRCREVSTESDIIGYGVIVGWLWCSMEGELCIRGYSTVNGKRE